MLRSLDHLIIGVQELEPAETACRDLLGLMPSWRGDHGPLGSGNVVFQLANTFIELLAPIGPGPTADSLNAYWAAGRRGMLSLAFATDDADACHKWFAENDLSPGPVKDGYGDGCFGDPERALDHGADHEATAPGPVRRHWRSVSLPAEPARGIGLFAVEYQKPPGMAASRILPQSTVCEGVEPTSSVTAVDHVVIETADIEAARTLYRDKLGLRLALERQIDDWGVHLLMFRIGKVTIEVAARLRDDGPPTRADRLWGISYQVSDIEAAHRRIASAGFAVSPVRSGRRPGTRVMTVRQQPLGVETLMIEPART